ncbi:MAG: InlB B-repeat-containing protein [Clostridia bacterium]|nr:InlB B-repeat-containing protein [Clostridia bacterium]
MKRTLALVLCMLMLVAALPLTGFAAYENTHTNTGNQIEDLIAVATTQIGYTEGNNAAGESGTTGGSGNYTKYGRWYGINPGAWCAMFVSWCANQAGIPTSVITKHASCDLGMQWFQNNGVWKWSPACGGSYVPKRGDIIYFRTKTNQVTDSTHVGIVYDSSSSTVYTIEGNASNKCQKKSYSLSSAYILGYGTPAYTSTSYEPGVYKVTATNLNMRAGAGTGYDILATLANGDQVTITKVSGTWGYCTFNGVSGWVSMKYLSLVSATQTYTITFDAGEGSITSGSSSYSILYGQQYSAVMSAAPVATRNGYALAGWYCAAYGYTLNLSDTYGVTENATFTAVWTPVYGIYETTASWLSMREGPGTDYTAFTSLPQGTQVNITAIDGKWGYCTYEGQNGWVSLNYCTYIGEATAATYTLTFNTNGGTMPEGYSTVYEFEADELFVDVIGGYPVPTKDGYDFTGWRRSDWNSDFWTDGWGTQPFTYGYNITLNAEYVEASCEHNYVAAVTTQATCTTDGVRTYTCSLCGESYTETIAKTGHSYSEYFSDGNATCLEDGTMSASCDNGCGSISVEPEEGSAKGHSFGEWYTVVEPQVGSEGQSRRDCANCDAYETETIPELEEIGGCEPELTVSGYKVMLSCADSIYYVRYAKGEYTTHSQIKNAEDCVTLNSTSIIKNTVSGICTLTMPAGGVYSVWVKTYDGVEYIFRADLSVMDQYVTTEGVSITVNNLYGVKDFFIAPGDYDTYSEVKANYIVLVSSVKINGASSYKYIVPNPGMYTIYVRYEDSARPASIIKTTCTVAEPSFNGNGLQLTLSNLEDIKVVRTAYGTYSTPGEIKRAAGQRSFSGATVMKSGTGNYTIQYRENGTVTVAIVYTHGYEVIFNYEVQKKVPSFVQNGNTVTFGQLDDLNVLRYAAGRYSTSSQIKAAAGSKALKSSSIIDGFITVTLDPGTYTFCVQYFDESYNYYVVTVE